MGGEHHTHDKKSYSHFGVHYPSPQVAYPPHGNSYSHPVTYPYVGYPPHVGHSSHAYSSYNGYPPLAYPSSSAPCYPGHGRSGIGTFFAGGAAAVAHHMVHGHGHGSHGYGHYGYYHGKYKHGKFKHGKFGKRWKHKMWK